MRENIYPFMLRKGIINKVSRSLKGIPLKEKYYFCGTLALYILN
jgi:hypothetical protein